MLEAKITKRRQNLFGARQDCVTFWLPWATLEVEEKLSWVVTKIVALTRTDELIKGPCVIVMMF